MASPSRGKSGQQQLLFQPAVAYEKADSQKVVGKSNLNFFCEKVVGPSAIDDPGYKPLPFPSG
jgi:hypothetical protein